MFERRSFLRGLASLPFVDGGAALIGSPVRAAVPSGDHRLSALADELAALQARIDAFRGSDDDFAALDAGRDALVNEMEATPADGPAGVLHKIRAADLPIVGDDGQAHDLMCSICEDVARLHGLGVVS